MAVFTAAGCSVGKLVDRTTLKRLSPGMLATADVPQACAAGRALSPVVVALGHGKPVKKQALRASSLTLLAAGMCPEIEIWEAELAAGAIDFAPGGDPKARVAAMKDGLYRTRRLHTEAARRYFAAFTAAQGAFGAPTDSVDCPQKLQPREELLYLLSLTAGLLAYVHDSRAERVVGVPGGIPQEVARGAACVDTEKYWGVPRALQAAVWASVPGAAPAGTDPWAILETAAGQGEGRGVWLGRALQAQVALDADKEELHRHAVTAHFAARAQGTGLAEVRLLNDFAERMVVFFSDRLWVREAGHRMPSGPPGLPIPAAATGAAAAPEPSAADLEILREMTGAAPAPAPAQPQPQSQPQSQHSPSSPPQPPQPRK